MDGPAGEDELFGAEFQIAGMRKAAALWSLVRDDPRFCYYGRMVSLNGPQEGLAGRLAAMTMLQGYASCQFFPAARYEAEAIEVAAKSGYETGRWEQYWGRETALETSETFLKTFAPPAGVTLCEVGPDTAADTVAAVARLQMACGVMPVPGRIMRGIGRKGVCLYAETAAGEVAAAGASFQAYHPESDRADEAFWGMLATHPDWRGQRLACWMGAEAIRRMHRRHGINGFSSGVKADNAASQSMCRRLGVEPSRYIYFAVSDPVALKGQPISR